MGDAGTGLCTGRRTEPVTIQETDPAATAEQEGTRVLLSLRSRADVELPRIEHPETDRRLENRSEPRSCVLALVRCRGIGHPRVRGPAELEWLLGDDARGGLPGHSATMRAARPAVQPVAAVPHAPAQLTPADAAKSAAQGNDLGLTCGPCPPTGKLALSGASAVRPTSLPRQVEPAEFCSRSGMCLEPRGRAAQEEPARSRICTSKPGAPATADIRSPLSSNSTRSRGTCPSIPRP